VQLVYVPAQPTALIQAVQHRVGQVFDGIRLIRQSQLLLAKVQVFERVAKVEQVRLPLAHGGPSFPMSVLFASERIGAMPMPKATSKFCDSRDKS